MITIDDDEARLRELLAPLQRIEPVRIPELPRKPHRSPLLVAALITAALLISGVAIAAGIGAFQGIKAADHPQRPGDVLDPATAKWIRAFNAHATGPGLRLLPGTARLIARLSGGRRFYVLATTSDGLCVFTETASENDGALGCGSPLTQKEPTTISSLDTVVSGTGGVPMLTYGIARNGVTAVSFRAKHREQTVPVNNNIWFYEGDNAALRSLTIHYADGKTQTITH